MEKFENYTYGRKITVESDHKPLEIICKKTLLNAPKRLQRMLLRLQKFDYVVVFKPGVEMYMADTLSRAYVKKESSKQDKRSDTEKEIETVNAIQFLPITTERCKTLQSSTEEDEELQILSKVIKKGWPNDRNAVNVEVQKYFPFREELTIELLCRKMQEQILWKKHILATLEFKVAYEERENAYIGRI